MFRKYTKLTILSLTVLSSFLCQNLWAKDGMGICLSNESYEHVIITSEALKNDTSTTSLSVLMNHRIEHGMSSVIVSTDSIYANYQGVDRQEQIRHFIRDAKAKWATQYVLLGGDVNIVPARMLYARSVNMASDMYYGCLDNSFNDDGDDKWGELNDGLDFEYEVYVGRASAQNSDEMHNFVYKTMTYENSPVNASYHTKMIHMSQEASGIGNTEKWCDRYREKSDNITLDYYRLTDAQADPVSNNRLSNGNVGYYLGASHGYVAKLANITIGEALKFTNADQFYFMTSIACLAGKFDENCIAEALCTSTQSGGAFAGMFNSEDAFPPYVVQYIYKLRDAHFVNKITKLGALRAEVAKSYSYSAYLESDATAMARRYQAYQYNLFGDPATDLKTVLSTPVDMELSFDSISDAMVMDESGNNNHATIHGAVATTQLLGSSALVLDGKSNYLSVPHNAWNPMGNQLEFTLAGWFYIDSLMGKTGLFVKGKEKNPFALYLNQDGHLRFELNKNQPANAWKNRTWTSDIQLKEKGLYHISLVLEYRSLAAYLYIDGELKETITIPKDYLLGGVNEPLYIGKDPNATDGCLKGSLDDVVVYSRALSAAKVRGLSSKEKPFSITRAYVAYAETSQLKDEKASDEYSYNYEDVTSKAVAVVTQVSGSTTFTGSVVYQLGDVVWTANDTDFSSFEPGKEFNALLNTKGVHHLSVQLFSDKGGKGMLLDARDITITILANASIMEATDGSEAISVGPIPADASVHISNTGQSQDYMLSMYSLSGMLVLQEQVHLTDHYSLDVSALVDGLYLLNLENPQHNITFTVIKKS